MATIGASDSSVTSMSDKQKDIQVGGFKLNDERGIGVKVYSALLLILEVIFLLIRMTYVNIEAFFKLFITPEEKDVKDEIVLITGTGHGIGREIALQLSSLGAIIVCIDINEKNNDETVNEIKERGGKAHSFLCDVSKRENVIELGNRVRSTVGEVSILINNAGIMPCHSLFTHKEDEIKKLYDLNVFAHFWLLQAFVPSMINRNHGHIVALSSMAGVLGIPYLVPYCGTKFAVRGIMESLHEELREDPRGLQIKFTTVYPYIVDTGLCKKPKIRFPNLMKIVTPKEAASTIITAMRREYVETSIPSILLYINHICRTMPVKIALLLKGFLDSGLEPHE